MFLSNLLSNGLIYAIIYIVALVICLTIHEYAHALAAYKLGDPTAKLEGRLTLNPLAHLDPVGTIFLLLVGFGWGKPVPINPNYFKKRSDEIIVSLAGICSNLLLAIIIVIPIKIALGNGVDIFSSPLYYLLSLIFIINIILAMFNLLPIPPLDGSHVVEYFLSDESRQTFEAIGPYLLIAYLVFDQYSSNSLLIRAVEAVVKLIAGSNIARLFFG